MFYHAVEPSTVDEETGSFAGNLADVVVSNDLHGHCVPRCNACYAVHNHHSAHLGHNDALTYPLRNSNASSSLVILDM